MWKRSLRSNSTACSSLSSFQELLLPTSKLGPCADSCVGGFVYLLGPCGSLQWTLLWSWEFLLLLQPHRFFQAEVLKLYFPSLEPWVAGSVSLPSCSSWFIRMQMWGHLLRQPLPAPILNLSSWIFFTCFWIFSPVFSTQHYCRFIHVTVYSTKYIYFHCCKLCSVKYNTACVSHNLFIMYWFTHKYLVVFVLDYNK